MNTTQNVDGMDFIRKTYGPEARILHCIRHGFKTSDGKHITRECLKNIMEGAVPQLTNQVNVLHPGSAEVRSTETGMAAAMWIVMNGGKIHTYLFTDSRLGSPAVFSMYDAEVKAAMKARGLKNYQALAELKPEDLDDWKEDLKNWTEETFSELAPGDVCLVPCHSPTVEALYNVYAKESDDLMTVAELEGIFLVKTKDDEIIVIR